MFGDLIASLAELTRLTIVQNLREHIPFEKREVITFPTLLKTINQLEKTASGPVEQSDPQATKKRWDQLEAQPEKITASSRDYKRFCWTPEIVIKPKFRKIFVDGDVPVTTSSLRGLVYGYHANFSDFDDSNFITRLRTLIQRKAPGSTTINSWSKRIDCILGVKAPSNLAAESSKVWLAPEQQLKMLDLQLTTDFARCFAVQFAQLAANKFDTLGLPEIKDVIENILCSELLRQDRAAYKDILARIILSVRAFEDEQVQGLLIDFLLKKEGIGDPRIYPENWAGIRDGAKRRVIQWLSREDINFFFELLLRDSDDKHGRKSFWLKYVNRISRSRALVSPEDLRHHAIRLREMEEKGRSFGKLVGSGSSSAFVLDFGQIVVVEFSEVGNACYIYSKRAFTEVVEDFWCPAISAKLLKNQELVSERITRSMKDWQGSARLALSRFGVRRD